MSSAAATALKTSPWRERFEAIEGILPGAGSPWVRELRRGAIESFARSGFPSGKLEAWRYFDGSELGRGAFRSAAGGRLAREAERKLLDFLLPGADLRRAVFVNGAYAPAVSDLGTMPAGVFAGSLAAALTSVPELVEPHLARLAAPGSHPFLDLNAAFAADGFFLHLRRGAALDEPIHLVFLAEPAAAPSMTHPRVVVAAEEGSRASVVQSSFGSGAGSYLANKVTEIALGPGASVEHLEIQEEGAEAVHVSCLRTRIESGARFSSHVVSLGAASARNEIGAVLAGPGASCALDGLYVAGHTQSLDHLTIVDHAAPGGTSQQLYKGVLDGRATGSFTGRVIVRPGAAKTDAAQTCRNLLLSDEATVNARPELEIDNSDVKCSHGATSGQLDKDAVFYLRSRGIAEEESRIMLMRAFVDEVIDRIGVASLRAHLHSRVDGRVAAGRRKKEAV